MGANFHFPNQQPGHPRQGQRPGAAPAGPQMRLAPLEVPLTCQEDPPLLRRALLAGATFMLAVLLTMGAFRIASEGGTGLLGIGFGRIDHLLTEADVPRAWLIAVVEQLHFAALSGWFAFTLWFGTTARPQPLPREQLYFHRRQSAAVHLPGLVLGAAGLMLGAWLAQWGLAGALAAALVEAGALTLGFSAAWSMLLPEARLTMSVILDREEGFGNRILIGSGVFQRLGRRTIRHYELLGADTVAFPGTEALADCRGLKLRYESAGGKEGIGLRGIAGRAEIDHLSDFLNTRFTRALHPLVFTYPAARQPGRAELAPNWRR